MRTVMLTSDTKIPFGTPSWKGLVIGSDKPWLCQISRFDLSGFSKGVEGLRGQTAAAQRRL